MEADVDRNGVLSTEELCQLLAKKDDGRNYSAAELDHMMRQVDDNFDGECGIRALTVSMFMHIVSIVYTCMLCADLNEWVALNLVMARTQSELEEKQLTLRRRAQYQVHNAGHCQFIISFLQVIPKINDRHKSS